MIHPHNNAKLFLQKLLVAYETLFPWVASLSRFTFNNANVNRIYLINPHLDLLT